jgi:hypothetical protein
MGPYREMPHRDVEPDSVDDRGLLWLWLVVGLVPCLVVAIFGGRWGVEPTLGLTMALVALVLLFRRPRA